MSRKIKRVFCDRPPTPEEHARIDALRRDVQAEFPPVTSTAARENQTSAAHGPELLNSVGPQTEGDAEHLRDWIAASERALREIWDNEQDDVYDTQ